MPPGELYASVTDDDRRRQTPATVTSLAPTLCVGVPVKKWENDKSSPVNIQQYDIMPYNMEITSWPSYITVTSLQPVYSILITDALLNPFSERLIQKRRQP